MLFAGKVLWKNFGIMTDDSGCELLFCQRNEYTQSNVSSYILCQSKNETHNEALSFTSASDVEMALKNLQWEIFVIEQNATRMNATCATHNRTNSSYCYSNDRNLLLSENACSIDPPCQCTNTNTNTYNALLREVTKKLLSTLFVLTVLAIFGNSYVMVHNFKKLCFKFYSKSTEKKIHYFLVLNLSFANFILAVCALMFAIEVEIHYQEIDVFYIEVSRCNAIGHLAYVSNQVSVSTLVMISAFRLYSVINPYKIVHFKSTVTLVLVCWSVWILIASIPFMNTILFSIGIRFKNYESILYLAVENFVENLSHTNATDFTQSILQGILSHKTPAVMHQAIDSLGLINDTLSYDLIGYYNAHTMCTLDILIEYDKPAAYITFFLVMFNFCSFLFMVIAYFIIIKRLWQGQGFREYIKQSSCCCCGDSLQKRASSSAKRRGDENQRALLRIFCIIITEFFCWIPMTAISFSYLFKSSYMTSCELCEEKNDSAWAAALLVPLILGNTLVIPYIYSTEVWVSLLKKISRKRKDGKKYSAKVFNSLSAVTVVEHTHDRICISNNCKSTAV